MDEIVYHSIDGYRIGSTRGLATSQAVHLVEAFQNPPERATGVLAGRTSVTETDLAGVGQVIIKHYRRGGLLANLIKHHYLKTSKTRGQIEFEQMERAGKHGINVPQPVAFGYRGRLIYRAWLVTQKVMDCQTLALYSQISPERIPAIMEQLGRQIRLLVKNRILHADFHPGNVLVDNSQQIYIIDFDKSALYRGSLEALQMKYRLRWCRAIQKHGLPPALCTCMTTTGI